MQLKALAIGLEAQDYENDKVEVADVEGYGQRTIEVDSHTLQRLAEPGDVAHAIVFLASERAAMITGHTLPVDGGFLAQ